MYQSGMVAEPGVLDRCVAGDEVEQHLQAALVGRRHQPVEVGQRAEHRVDVRIVGHVVAEVGQRRWVERRDPERVDAQPRQVVEPRGDAREVPDAVVVRILERAGIDLVDDSVAPRHRAAQPRRLTRIHDTHEIDPLTDPRWDAYVRAHPRAIRLPPRRVGQDPRALVRVPAPLPGLSAGRFPGGRAAPVPQEGARLGRAHCARSRSSRTAGRWRTTTSLDDSQLIEAARDIGGRRPRLTINTDDRRLRAARRVRRWRSSCRAGWWRCPQDLEALRAGWRKTSNNLFRSLKKADEAGARVS